MGRGVVSTASSRGDGVGGGRRRGVGSGMDAVWPGQYHTVADGDEYTVHPVPPRFDISPIYTLTCHGCALYSNSKSVAFTRIGIDTGGRR